MKKLLVMLLALTMTFSLVGCNKNKEETLTPPDENFEEDAQEEEADPVVEEEKEPEHDAAVAKELESVSATYNGVIRAMYQPDVSKDGVSYVPSDSQFFWLSVYFTALHAGEITSEVILDGDIGTLTVPAEIIQEYAAANFGTKQSLPEIPQEISYIKADGDNYVLQTTDAGDTGTAITKAYKNSDGSYTAFVEFFTSEGTLGSYKFTYQENTAEETLFKYQVTDAVLVK